MIFSITLGIIYYVLSSLYCYIVLQKMHEYRYKKEEDFIVSLLTGFALGPLQIISNFIILFYNKMLVPLRNFIDHKFLKIPEDKPKYYKIFYTQKEYDEFCRKLKFNNTLDSELE